MPSDFESRVSLIDDFTGTLVAPFGNTHDLFADGSALIVRLPGHARGQLGLLANTVYGRILFAADSYWMPASLEQHELPNRIMRFFGIDDWNAMVRTIDNLADFALASRGKDRTHPLPRRLSPIHGRALMNKLSALAGLAKRYIQTTRRAGLRGEALREYQDAQAQRIVAYAIERSPFYRRHFAGLRLKKWREFPTIDKSIMMLNFDDFNTKGVRYAEAMKLALDGEASRNYQPSLGELTVGLSSGTSGHRGLFVLDPGERAAWAGTLLAYALPPLRVRGFKALLFLRSR